MKLLSSTWLAGKYTLTGAWSEIDAEINTSLPFVSIGEYFWQGDDADSVINEINIIYNNEDICVQDAITKYANLYLD